MNIQKIKPGYKSIKTLFGKVEVIPQEWDWIPLGDICKVTSGSTPSREHPEYFKGVIPWVVSGELNYDEIFDTTEKITDEAVKHAHLKMLDRGTVLIAITGLEADGTRGRCGMLGTTATTSQSCVALHESKNFYPKFFFYYYQHYGKKIVNTFAQGTKQQSLSVGIVKAIKIQLPPKDQQKKIADILSNLDLLIKKNQEIYSRKQSLDKIDIFEKSNLETLKKGLMQKLLTGQIRVKV